MRHSYDSIFISPHIDDVVYSCGGTLARSCRDGKALVVSIFSDSGCSTVTRKREEERAARLLGYDFRFFDFPDNKRRDRLGKLPFRMHRSLKLPQDAPLLEKLTERLKGLLLPLQFQKIYFPLGIGRHIDHTICAHIGLTQSFAGTTFFYEDVPYVMKRGQLERRLQSLSWPVVGSELVPIDDFFELKLKSVWVYESQTIHFFKSWVKTEKIFVQHHRGVAAGGLFERFWRLATG